VVRRYSNGPHYIRKYGGKFTAAQAKVALKYRQVAPFVLLDIFTVIVHARILLDRAVGVSRLFFPRGNRPPFGSFNDHKKWMLRVTARGITDTQYADVIRNHTDWLSGVLKDFRDHGLIHNERVTTTTIVTGWTREDNHLILWYTLPNGFNTGPASGEITLPMLVTEIESFLKRFNRTGKLFLT
jgi:hypothetical protein